MKKVIMTDKAPKPVGPYSQAIEVENLLFCSGQIAINPETNEFEPSDIATQTRLVMKNIHSVIQKAGYGWNHIVKTTIFLTDLNDFATVNEIYGEVFKDRPPARSTIQVAALPKGANVEIEVLADKDA